MRSGSSALSSTFNRTASFAEAPCWMFFRGQMAAYLPQAVGTVEGEARRRCDRLRIGEGNAVESTVVARQ